MKKILKLFVLLFALQFCHAQQEKIVELKQYYNPNNKEGNLFTYYYKDVNNYFTPFIGTWIYQNGNQTFVLQLWKKTKVEYPATSTTKKMFHDELSGHYKMIQNYGQPNETVLYTSQINIGSSSTPWPTIIAAGKALENYKMTGTIFDVAGPLHPNYQMGIEGNLVFTINANSNPLTAKWKVTLPMGMRGSDEPSTFTIPTDIILTKVN